ncbi:probable RNA-binding protein 46 [Cephus cinctus]|uniref:Probable RNA-binding protein 46 n=1 Tax=Cephus cinctus TaxID=211228 RepID=A0AAJ7FH74_CEPCN|nr:probable RNA-binding protein 46 [Cephus cinctus]
MKAVKINAMKDSLNGSISPAESVDRSDHITVRLLDLVKNSGYDMIQENGQRRMRAPELFRETQWERAKGAEIFLGRLPRDCFEDELLPLLERVGRVFELRLMLDFSGSTRGYAFALYENSRIARRACEILDGLEIRPGRRIGVVKSIDNCRLFFGGVPKDKNKEEFLEELSKIVDGITDVYVYPSSQNRKLNRGFIFVEFKDHKSAAMARRQLVPGRVVLWDHEVAVDWADPEPGDLVDTEIMDTVTTLFVRNLCLETPQQVVREIFQQSTGIPVMKIKKINHFAFLHYENREQARRALEMMNKSGSVAEKSNWEVRWAKPISSVKAQERQRCINDAIATSARRKQKSLAKRVSRRSRNSTSETKIAVKNELVDILDYKKILENYTRNKFSGECRFQCYQCPYTFGCRCEITLCRDNKLFFQLQGSSFSTPDEAIARTSRLAYEKLRNMTSNSGIKEAV